MSLSDGMAWEDDFDWLYGRAKVAVCQIEEINKGGAYPKSCPRCFGSGKCALGLSHPFDKNQPKYAVLYKYVYNEDDTYGGFNRREIDAYQTFPNEKELLSWIQFVSDKYPGYKVIKYQLLEVETTIRIK